MVESPKGSRRMSPRTRSSPGRAFAASRSIAITSAARKYLAAQPPPAPMSSKTGRPRPAHSRLSAAAASEIAINRRFHRRGSPPSGSSCPLEPIHPSRRRSAVYRATKRSAEIGGHPAEPRQRKRASSRHDHLRVDEHTEVVEPTEPVILDFESDAQRQADRQQEAEDAGPTGGQADDQEDRHDRLAGGLGDGEYEPVRGDEIDEDLA